MTLHDTLAFAHEMHRNVADWTGLPYIAHPIAVMLLLPPECTDEDRHLALLHDVVEDCQQRLCAWFGIVPMIHGKTMSNLEELYVALANGTPDAQSSYNDYVVHGLRLLTRDSWPGLSYTKYVRNIVSSGHRGAMWVKYADNMHNTDPSRRARLTPELFEQSIQMDSRYQRSMAILRAGLGITQEV